MAIGIDAALVLIVAAAALLIHISSGAGEFILDDLSIQAAIKPDWMRKEGWRLRNLIPWHRFARHYSRPWLFWTYARDAHFHGGNHRQWHWTNLAFHAVNTAAVFGIARFWLDPLPAAIGALAFAANPLAVASVASIAGRSSVLAGTWILLAMIAVMVGAWLALPLLLVAAWRCREESAAYLPWLALAAFMVRP